MLFWNGYKKSSFRKNVKNIFFLHFADLLLNYVWLLYPRIIDQFTSDPLTFYKRSNTIHFNIVYMFWKDNYFVG